MRKSPFYIVFLFGLLLGFSGTAHAQFVVSDPTLETETGTIATEMGTANTELTAIARSTQAMSSTMADMLTMLNAPNAVVGLFRGLDGGARTGSPEDSAQFMPALAGRNSVTALAIELLAQERGDLMADEQRARLPGNSEDEQAMRQRLVGTNIQGLAYGDLRTYGTRFLATGPIEDRLSTANIQQATILNGAIALKSLETLNLLGQSISLNTAALAETRLQSVNDILRIEDDHRQTARQFMVP